MAFAFAAYITVRNAPELLVDSGDQLIQSLSFAMAPSEQKMSQLLGRGL
jgi:hypothetical protein